MTTTDTPSARPGRHSLDDVLAAATAILDENGLPDLTMRRLAASLGVQPSALYWHVANKQTLLALIADRIVSAARVADSSEGGWKGATRAEALALRDALLTYRDGAEVVSSTLALGLGANDARRRLSAALAQAGPDADAGACSDPGADPGRDAVAREMAAAALLHFVLGHVWHEQQRLQADSLGVVAAEHSSDPDAATATHDGPGSFEFGVDLLLDGLAARSSPSRLGNRR
jgi:AcrR family transcriptional regulator